MPKDSKKPNEWLTPAQVAEMLDISKQRVSQLIKSGRLPVVNIDGKYYISPREVEALKDRKTGRPRKEETSGDAEIWEITIKATVKIERKPNNEIKTDETDPNDE